MIATFMQTMDNPNVLNKHFINEKTIEKTIRLLDNCNLFNFQIIVSDFDLSLNYVYIPLFGRWYFITDYEIMHNGLYKLTLKVDVLYTYRNNILQAEHHVIKSDVPIGDVIDYENKAQKTILTYDINTPFNSAYSDVMITARG